jgi:hypothetical protein
VTPDARRIVARETAISVAINMAISAAMFLALFGLRGPAIVRGLGGYAVDFLPQTFMVALMGSLVPGLLTAARAGSRERLSLLRLRGAIALVARALLVAMLASLVAGGGAVAILLGFGIVEVAPLAGLLVKMAYGGLVALGVTPAAVRFALCEAKGKVALQ